MPALKHGDWGCYESTVLMEYLEDIQPDTPLLPPNPKRRAHSRVWTDHINRNIVPAFYRYLQEQDNQKQVEHASALRAELTKLVEAADPQGPFFLGKQMTFVDVQIAPWVIRLHRVLKPYRGWPDVEPGSRWSKWVDAIEANESVKATTSSDDLYLDSYERYAGMSVSNSLLRGRDFRQYHETHVESDQLLTLEQRIVQTLASLRMRSIWAEACLNTPYCSCLYASDYLVPRFSAIRCS